MKKLDLPGQKKIKNRKDIEQIFTSGETLIVYPLRAIYTKKRTVPCTQVTFSVPKKNFKLAVMRNRIKRRVREAYRLHQYDLDSQKYQIMFIYISKKELPIESINTAIKKMLARLNRFDNIN